MKASVILAHPYAKSFNHAIYETVCNTYLKQGVEVYRHDLYAEGFNPVISELELGKIESSDPLVLKYVRELIDSKFIVFIHPNWWGQPPAILKGYIDRVIRPPHSYEFTPEDNGGGIPIGKFSDKIGIVLNTSNTEEKRENEYFHDPLEYIWKRCVFGFCGIENSYRVMFRVIADSTDNARKRWLSETEQLIQTAMKNI